MEESERAGDGRKEFQVCLLLCKASRKERRRNPLPTIKLAPSWATGSRKMGIE